MASQIRELEARKRVLTQTIYDLNRRVKNLSSIIRNYNDIERELDIAINNLNQFLVKREALSIEIAQTEVPWQLLAPLGEPKPSSASAKNQLVLGTVLGLLLGIGAALVVDKISNAYLCVLWHN